MVEFDEQAKYHNLERSEYNAHYFRILLIIII